MAPFDSVHSVTSPLSAVLTMWPGVGGRSINARPAPASTYAVTGRREAASTAADSSDSAGGTRPATATCLANREDEQRRHLAQFGGRAVHVARCSTDPPSRKRHDEKRHQRDARYGDYRASPVEQAQEKRSQRPDGQVSESMAWIT